MHDERVNLIVGLVLLPLIVIAVGAVLIIGKRPLRPVVRLQAEFDNVDQLRQGAKVRIANQIVGQVTHIAFKDVRVGGKIVPKVRVHFWIYRKYQHQVYANSKAFIASLRLIGERFLEIAAPDDEAPGKPIKAGGVLAGTSPAFMDRLMTLGFENVTLTLALMDEMEKPMEQAKASYARVENQLEHYQAYEPRLRRLSKQAEALVADAEAQWRTLERVTDKGRAFDRLGNRVDRLATRAKARIEPLRRQTEALIKTVEAFVDFIKRRGPGLRDTLTFRFDRIAARFKRVQSWIDSLVAHIKRGDGTLGGFLRDREMFDDVKTQGRVIRQQIWNTISRPKKMNVKGSPVVP